MGRLIQIGYPMKKIVIFIDQLHSHGGIEKLVALKANYWADVFGYQVTIVATEQDTKPIVYPLSDKVEFIDLGIGYDRSESYFSAGNSFKCLKNIFRVQSYILREKPDFMLVASHIPVTYFLPFLIRKGKIAKEFHFTKSERSKNKGFKTKLIDFIEARYDFLLVLSAEEKSFYPSTNTVVIPNPVEMVSKNIQAIHERPKIAVAVARFAPVKQLDKMVKAWKLFSANNPDWQLHIFGSTGGGYFNTIKQLAVSENVQQSMLFCGESDQVLSEMAKARVLLMTSEQECFPMVILEANSVGTPVISFDSPTGPRNIIHHKQDGILVDYNNCGSFAAALDEYANDIHLQQLLSGNAQLNAAHYAVETIMEKWNRLIFKADD